MLGKQRTGSKLSIWEIVYYALPSALKSIKPIHSASLSASPIACSSAAGFT